MGIPGFFKWLTNPKRYPNIVQDCIEYEPYYDRRGVLRTVDKTRPNPNGMEFDNLYLDMNGLIHSSVNASNDSKLTSENEVIQSILDNIDRIFTIVRPRQLLYIAIDGVAPRAKLNQQRSRRVLDLQNDLDTAKEMEAKKTQILASGNILPDTSNEKETIEPFDANCVTCGTAFMLHLSEHLQCYISERILSEPAWQSIEVILSDANVPGEGEQKIINFIRQRQTLSTYNPETSHVLFGTDADLILLGIATREQYVIIMRNAFIRQQPRFCDLCRQHGHNFKDCQGLPKENLARSKDSTSCPIKAKYIFVHLSILSNTMFHILWTNNPSGFEWDYYRFLDDWVFICLMMGNDFLPDIPSFAIHENAIDDLMEIYSHLVPQMNAYLTDDGKLNIEFFKIILTEFGQMENEKFQNRHKLREEWLKSNRPMKMPIKPSLNPDKITDGNQITVLEFQSLCISQTIDSPTISSTEAVSSESAVDPQEGNQVLEDNVRLWEEGWRERYYQVKFHVDHDHLEEKCRAIVQDYTRGLQWVLQYYYHGVPSWDWYYPHHYAPFASDFAYLNNMSQPFNTQSEPLKPLEQLICLLTTQFAKHLPENWQSLITASDSPIIDLHLSNFSIDPNGKHYQSQYTAVLPFINEAHLHEVLEEYYPLLTSEETKRNEVHNDLLFIHPDNQFYHHSG